jgi:hypothetical protein
MGEVPGPIRIVALNRPGLPDAEELDPFDPKGTIEAAKYNVGLSTIGADGSYEISDVPDGTYIIEIPRIPTDMEEYARLSPEERQPFCRRTVDVGNGQDVKLDLSIIRGAGLDHSGAAADR